MMKTKVNCGGVEIGGDAPVSIQSMTNTKTADAEATIAQCRRLMDAGCDIIRITINTKEAAEGFAKIRKKIDAPLVADIHFDYTLALAAVNAGADKIRINPGNIGDTDRVRQVVRACSKAGIPIRVGVNSGSLEKEILAKYGGVCAAGLAESAIKNAEILEHLGFNDIVLSLKASDVRMNNEAYRIADRKSCYPLHIGVTEAGTVNSGIIKSSIGIGSLLLDGIGNTMRVSLTADPVREVAAAKEILKALDLREGVIEIVSCPTCGRTEVDLEKIASEIETRLSALEKTRAGGKKLKVAVMGCAVNGPGEAGEADIGVACGRGEALIFRRGEIIKKVKESEITEETARMVMNYENL